MPLQTFKYKGWVLFSDFICYWLGVKKVNKLYLGNPYCMLYRFTNYPGAQALFKLVSHNIKINIVTRLLPLEVSCEVCHQHWQDKGLTLDSHCVKHQRGCASFYLPQRLKNHHDFHSVFIFPLLFHFPMCSLPLHFPANISLGSNLLVQKCNFTPVQV